MSTLRPAIWFKLTLLFLATSIVVLLCITRFVLTGSGEGIYLLKGTSGSPLEVTDILLFEDYRRLLGKIEFAPVYARFPKLFPAKSNKPYIKFRWDKTHGYGYLIDFFPDRTKLLVCFGNRSDRGTAKPPGLFIGGGLPASHYETDALKTAATGMAFSNGMEWQTFWGATDEAISSGRHADSAQTPIDWTYDSSKLLYATQRKAIFMSRHAVDIDGMPLQISRFVLHRAGDHYIILAIRIKNLGTTAVDYRYHHALNGLEQGGYPSLGWLSDRLLQTSAEIDPRRHAYGGFVTAGDRHSSGQAATGTANFIEWLGDAPPDVLHFANSAGRGGMGPQQGGTVNRLMITWRSRRLAPKGSDVLVLAIGLAGRPQPPTGLPVKPVVTLEPYEREFFMNN